MTMVVRGPKLQTTRSEKEKKGKMEEDKKIAFTPWPVGVQEGRRTKGHQREEGNRLRPKGKRKAAIIALS